MPALPKTPVCVLLLACLPIARAGEETHASLQAVTPTGASAWKGEFPFTIRGVLLCDPDEMLDPTPAFLPWDSGTHQGRLGGECQITFQAVTSGDRGGTTCWAGQNYGNLPWLHDSALSYPNPAWTPTNLWSNRRCTVTDGAGRFLTLRHPRYSLGPAPGGPFDAVGIFTQESGSGAQGTNGYELFAQQIIPQAPAPLGIASQVAISWPQSGASYQLECRSTLSATDWQPVTNTPVAIDGRNTVLVPPPAGPAEQFYRLRKTN